MGTQEVGTVNTSSCLRSCCNKVQRGAVSLLCRKVCYGLEPAGGKLLLYECPPISMASLNPQSTGTRSRAVGR